MMVTSTTSVSSSLQALLRMVSRGVHATTQHTKGNLQGAIRFQSYRPVWVLLICLCTLGLQYYVPHHSLVAMAGVQESVSMKRLGIVEETIYLPTVSSKRDVNFYVPKNANLTGASHVSVTFQHAYTLDPSRSWLQVMINDQVIHQVALGPNNTNSTTVKVPLPIGRLKAKNKLTFRVRQHYKAKCEDPTDASLWTQILPSTRLVLDYQPVVAPLDLARYPFPVVDTFSYLPAKVQFILPNAPQDAHLEAMGILNAHLAMKAPKEPKIVSAASLGMQGMKYPSGDMMVIGTASEVSGLLSSLGVSQPSQLSGSQWSGINTGEGVIWVGHNPKNSAHVVLVVSGNDANGVIKAAKMLSKAPRDMGLKGQFVTTSAMVGGLDTAPEANKLYIGTESRTLSDLGFQTTAVYKLHAPPVYWDVPVVRDFNTGNGKLFLNLVYSYSMMLNPKYSSIELKVNDRSVANVPLQQPYGEKLAKTRIYIPGDVLKPLNRFVVQFHLLPDKYGYCKGEYIDIAHGILHDSSQFEVEGMPDSALPRLDMFTNSVGYPYTSDNTLQNVWVHVTNPTDTRVLNTLLNVTTHMGRHLKLQHGHMQLHVSAQPQLIPSDKHLLVISGNGEMPQSITSKFRWNRMAGNDVKYTSQNESFYIQQGGAMRVLEQAGDDAQALTHFGGFNTPASLYALGKSMEATHLEQAISQLPVVKVRQLAQLDEKENTLIPADEPKKVTFVATAEDSGESTQEGGTGSKSITAVVGGTSTGKGSLLSAPMRWVSKTFGPVVAPVYNSIQGFFERIGWGTFPWVPIVIGLGLLLMVRVLLGLLGGGGGPRGNGGSRQYY
ncbi:MAG: cellulose biosynthesis cyclic di-GMP-binding regulatory protein BcsB [Vampirovibrionales bacterium]